MKKIMNQFGKIAMTIVIGILALYIALEIFVPSMTLSVFGFKPYQVITVSMEPVLHVDDIVIVQRFDIDELEVNDIITFRADVDYNGVKDTVTHYIYSITELPDGEYQIRTIRQNGVTADPWILAEEDILGLYAFHIPALGIFANFIRSPFGVAIIIIDVAALIGILYLLKKNPQT